MAASPASALQFLRQNSDHFLDELKEFLRIPSVSIGEAHRADMQTAADWVAKSLRALPMQAVEVCATDGHPIVYGENLGAGHSAPTILIYGHYDVQPAEPLSDWNSPPFEPTVRGDNLFARGATDMKGQVMASLNAVQAVAQTGSLGVNIKVVIEGEEEIGSGHLQEFLGLHREQLACDYALNADAGGMPDSNTPAITYALRGGAWFRITVFGPRQDLHSGLFGGTIHNPIHALIHLIEGLQDGGGHITLMDFYSRVRVLDSKERSELGRSPLGPEYFLRQAGAPALWGDPQFTPLERTVARPSMNVDQFEGGHEKAAIPAKAMAVIGFRLVPDQDPDDVHEQLRGYLEANTVPTVTWELDFIGQTPAVLTSRTSPVVECMKNALEAAFQAPPVFQRCGGGIPVVLMLQQTLGVDSVLTGFSLTDDNLHGPNEKLHLPTWGKGTAALVRFLCNLDEAHSAVA
jgi:acetylornithine deacetylase/succinyl-diaminopimelate desuccinylase-like protein